MHSQTSEHETSIHLDSHLRYFKERRLVMTICTKQILPLKIQPKTSSRIYQRRLGVVISDISYILRLQLEQATKVRTVQAADATRLKRFSL